MIKYIFIVTYLLIFFTACHPTQTTGKQETDINDRVEVIYFHGAQRCPTCRAIEEQTKQLLETQYAEQLKSGEIVFREVDISKKENQPIADKYEVTWSSLFVNHWKEGKETISNLTDYAFKYARNAPETFQEEIKKEIESHRTH